MKDVLEWEYLDPPYFWEAINDYVIADRHLPDGTRQHMIKGHVKPGLIICNAQIIGQEDVTDVENEQDQGKDN